MNKKCRKCWFLSFCARDRFVMECFSPTQISNQELIQSTKLLVNWKVQPRRLAPTKKKRQRAKRHWGIFWSASRLTNHIPIRRSKLGTRPSSTWWKDILNAPPTLGWGEKITIWTKFFSFDFSKCFKNLMYCSIDFKLICRKFDFLFVRFGRKKRRKVSWPNFSNLKKLAALRIHRRLWELLLDQFSIKWCYDNNCSFVRKNTATLFCVAMSMEPWIHKMYNPSTHCVQWTHGCIL